MPWGAGLTVIPNAIFRMMQNLAGPRKGLIGPWGHKYPHYAMPGPRIGFLQECLRWWDQHLKGIDTGIMAEPMLRAWMQDPAPPAPMHDTRPGRWVAEERWPSAGVRARAVWVGAGGTDPRCRLWRGRGVVARYGRFFVGGLVWLWIDANRAAWTKGPKSLLRWSLTANPLANHWKFWGSPRWPLA